MRMPWIILSFAVAFVATGLMIWLLPYAKVELPNSLARAPMVLVAIAAVIARVKGEAGFLRTTVLIGCAVPAAIAVRVAVEVAQDPTSHNLWPFELVFGGVLGGALALIGATIGTVWVRTRKG